MRVEEDRLDDTLLHRSLVLEGAAAALAPLLDGATEWHVIRNAVIDLAHAPEAVDTALRRFLFLHAVEGAGDATVGKLERLLRHEEALPTSILEGARFGCQGSGSCCQGYAFGPLNDADVAGLDALDLAAAFPHVAPPYIESNEGGRFLRHDGDRCIFLTGDRRCGLHAAFGSEAKPGFCRLFPLESFATIEGIRVVDRGTCATFAVSARVGLPLVDDLPRARPLLPPPILHHPVVLVGESAWDYGLFLRFTTAATTLIKRNLGTASETLMAIGRCFDALTEATASCPLEPGQPDAIVTTILATDATSWYRPPTTDAAIAGTHAIGDLLRALADAINREQTHVAAARELAALVEHTAAAIVDDAAAALLGDAADALVNDATALVDDAAAALVDDAAAALVDDAAGALVDDAAAALVHDAATADVDDATTAVTPVAVPLREPAADPSVDEALRISMRQQLFGRHVLVGGHASAGLVRIAVIQLLALAGARLDAGTRALTAGDLNRGHVLATRGFESGKLDAVLVEHEPRWRLLLDGLARAAQLLVG